MLSHSLSTLDSIFILPYQGSWFMLHVLSSASTGPRFLLAAAMRARIHKSVRTVTAMLDSRWSSHRVPENSQVRLVGLQFYPPLFVLFS